MKKKFAIILIMLLALTCIFVACKDPKEPTKEVVSIEIVTAKTKYSVGDTISYDAVTLKVTYDDGTTETKTVRELGATVTTPADTSKIGESAYTLTYKGKSVNHTVYVVEYTVTKFDTPEFWKDYQQSQKGIGNDNESSFKVSAKYEVGNVNKFICNPYIEGFSEGSETSEAIEGTVKIIPSVYVLNDATFKLLEGSELAQYVTIDNENNAYQFTEAAAGKTFKIEMTIDENAYNISSNLTNKTFSVEFVVVDGGYNVYEQNGLAVMTDSFKDGVWDEILMSDGVALTLPADDKPLKEYIGNVNWIILHGNITIDPDLLPSSFFWQEGENGIETAKANMPTIFKGTDSRHDYSKYLVGSLKDGMGGSTRTNTDEYLDNEKIYLFEGSGDPHVQKALYVSSYVSLSGNFFSVNVEGSISDLSEDKLTTGERHFFTIIWDGCGENSKAPLGHWSIFKFQSTRDQAKDLEDDNKSSISMKNLSMEGNMTKTDSTVPSGIMSINCSVDELELNNIIASRFFTNMVADNFLNGAYAKGDITISNSRLFDSYSNMLYAWRAHYTIVNCEMKEAGGPLFILVDGNRTSATEDEKGPNITVDDKSVLESYCTGDEDWYAQYGAGALVSTIQSFDGMLLSTPKTILKSSDGKSRINVIAAIIPGTDTILESNPDIDTHGFFRKVDDKGNVMADYRMHNDYLNSVKALGAVVLQSGMNTLIYDGTGDYLKGSGIKDPTFSADTLCIYMQAAKTFPYFGVVLGLSDRAQA